MAKTEVIIFLTVIRRRLLGSTKQSTLHQLASGWQGGAFLTVRMEFGSADELLQEGTKSLKISGLTFPNRGHPPAKSGEFFNYLTVSPDVLKELTFPEFPPCFWIV
jgi:hypothetical protein